MSAPELRYVNHLGEEFDFGRAGAFPLSPRLRDWALDRELMNGRVASYAPRPRELEVGVAFASDARAAVDELVRVCAADAAACAPGRLYDGEWWTECFLEESSAELWWVSEGGEHARTLVFYSADPAWVRERAFSVPPSELHGALGHPHGYPHAYGSSSSGASVSVEAPAPCDVRIEVPGPADAPAVAVGGNVYRCAASVPAGGVLVVDTRAKSAEIRLGSGLRVDALDSTPDAPPGSGEYAFEKVAPGVHAASCSAPQGAAVTVYESGMERLWS